VLVFADNPDMNNQTTKNDPADRSEEGHFPPENELRSTWLGMLYVDRTFFDRVINEASIRQIRKVLDEEGRTDVA
jgi:hypothetical protein